MKTAIFPEKMVEEAFGYELGLSLAAGFMLLGSHFDSALADASS